MISICRKLSCLSAEKISTSSFTFYLRYCTCCFGYFGHSWLHTPKVILSTCKKRSCLSTGTKLTSSLTYFWRYCKDMQISYFGYFGHIWLRTRKMILSTSRKLQCLSACQKKKVHLAHNSRIRILPDMGLVVKYQ